MPSCARPGSCRSYPIAGTSAPATTASWAAGRASPTRTRPGGPTAARPAPGGWPPAGARASRCQRNRCPQANRRRRQCPKAPGREGAGPEDGRPEAPGRKAAGSRTGRRLMASRRIPRDTRWSGLRRPAGPGRTAAGRSCTRASRRRETDPRPQTRPCFPPFPGADQVPSAGCRAATRCCRRAARARRRRSWRPRRPGGPGPRCCRWPPGGAVSRGVLAAGIRFPGRRVPFGETPPSPVPSDAAASGDDVVAGADLAAAGLRDSAAASAVP